MIIIAAQRRLYSIFWHLLQINVNALESLAVKFHNLFQIFCTM